MELKVGNSLSSPYFTASGNSNMQNEALNFGVVTPPDSLPNPTLVNFPVRYEDPLQDIVTKGQKRLTAGQVSARLSIGAMLLSAVTLLAAFLKGKK